jgi:hypothetical protein
MSCHVEALDAVRDALSLRQQATISEPEEQQAAIAAGEAALLDAEAAPVVHPIATKPFLAPNDYPSHARAQRHIGHLYELGRRSLSEFLSALSQRANRTDTTRSILEDYAMLSPRVRSVLGADEWAPSPTHPVLP